MRHIFNALVDTSTTSTTSTTTTTTSTTTTPTPCKKAKAAYTDYCNGALNNARKAVCKQRTAWFSVKGNGNKTQKQYEDAIKVVAALLKIIATGSPKARKAAQATLDALPSRGILENSVLADKGKAKALKELGDLESAVKEIKGCTLPTECKGNNPSCKKLVNNNEERKNEMKNKRKNKPKNERKNKVKNKPKNERKNKMKNKPKNEKKTEKKTERKAERKAARKTERKAARKTERKAARKTERKNKSQSEE